MRVWDTDATLLITSAFFKLGEKATYIKQVSCKDNKVAYVLSLAGIKFVVNRPDDVKWTTRQINTIRYTKLMEVTLYDYLENPIDVLKIHGLALKDSEENLFITAFAKFTMRGIEPSVLSYIRGKEAVHVFGVEKDIVQFVDLAYSGHIKLNVIYWGNAIVIDPDIKIFPTEVLVYSPTVITDNRAHSYLNGVVNVS